MKGNERNRWKIQQRIHRALWRSTAGLTNFASKKAATERATTAMKTSTRSGWPQCRLASFCKQCKEVADCNLKEIRAPNRDLLAPRRLTTEQTHL